MSDVEFALIQKDVLYGLQQGTAVLKEIHREMGGLERVDLLMREGEEAREYQKVRSNTEMRIGGTLWIECTDLVLRRKSAICWEAR